MKKQKTRNIRKTKSPAWILAALLVSAAILTVAVGILSSSPSAKAQEASNQPQLETQDDGASVGFANQKIKIDAQTGRLRKPTVEEARALVETITGLTDRSSEGLKVERGPNSQRFVDLQGRFQSVILAKPNPDGTNEVRCVSTLEEAAAFLGIDPSKLVKNN